MNGYERAVIDAAKAWRASAYTSDEPHRNGALIAAVEALIESERGDGPVERLAEWITARYPNTGNNGLGARTAHCLMRAARHVGATTLLQFAAADGRALRDVRGAGPKVVSIWAKGLRALGIEPGWDGG